MSKSTLEYLAQNKLTVVIKHKKDIYAISSIPFKKLICIFNTKTVEHLAMLQPICESLGLIVVNGYNAEYRRFRELVEALNKISYLTRLELVSDPGINFPEFTNLRKLTIIDTMKQTDALAELLVATRCLKSLYISVHRYTKALDQVLDANHSLEDINIRINNLYDIPTQARVVQFAARNALIE